MALYCEVCGGQLSTWTKNKICGAACRQKRSRDKRQASQRAYDMGFTIDGWSKMLNQGVITHEEARDLLYVVWDRLGDFHKQVQQAREKAEAQTEQ